MSSKLEIDFVSVFYPVSFPIYVHEINIRQGLYKRGISHTVTGNLTECFFPLEYFTSYPWANNTGYMCMSLKCKTLKSTSD